MLYNGKVSRYKAQAGKAAYLDNRANGRSAFRSSSGRCSASPFGRINHNYRDCCCSKPLQLAIAIRVYNFLQTKRISAAAVE